MSTKYSPKLENLTQDELTGKARIWSEQRTVRALEQFADYRLMPDGALVNRGTGEVYHVDEATNRCTCPDEVERLSSLRAAMSEKLCGSPCECKHSTIRKILSGGEVRIGRSVYRMRRNLK